MGQISQDQCPPLHSCRVPRLQLCVECNVELTEVKAKMREKIMRVSTITVGTGTLPHQIWPGNFCLAMLYLFLP